MIRKILMVICIGVILITVMFEVTSTLKERALKKQTIDIADERTEAESTTDTSNDPLYRQIDFRHLITVNPDIIGWIYIPDTQIDYPILQASSDKNDDYYLNHSIDNQYEKHGSIYIQNINSKQLTDILTVIYGHNMRDGSMFAGIHKYTEQEYFDKHSTIYIYTPTTTTVYKALALTRRGNTHLLDEYKELFSTKKKERKNSLQNLLNYIAKNHITLNKQVHITNHAYIALSTCTKQNDKLVLFAYKDTEIVQQDHSTERNKNNVNQV